jgi:hypothetical protein
VSPPTWSQVVAGKHNFHGPLPPPAPLTRPQHTRSSSYGENKSQPLVRPAPVCLHPTFPGIIFRPVFISHRWYFLS